MATDYTNRMYWPSRGPEAEGEARTTYGKTIALTAKLHSSNQREELKELAEKRQAFHSTRQQGIISRYSAAEPRPGSNCLARNPHGQNRVDMTPVDMAVYEGASTDPFVPNNRFNKVAYNRIQREKLQRVPLSREPNQEYGVPGVHRLYRSAGGYDDNIKARNHARKYRPQVDEIVEARMRQGRGGGHWRHVKEVMQGKGQRIVFVDGSPLIDELLRVKTNLISSGVKIPRSTTEHHSKSEQYITLAERKGMESGNWNLMR